MVSRGGGDHSRKDNRIEEPVIYVLIEGETFPTLDWGLGGFRIGGYQGSIGSGKEFYVEGIGPAMNELFPVRVDCQAIRLFDEQLAVSFIELNSDTYDVLEALMMRRQKPLDKLRAKLGTVTTQVEVLGEDQP